MLYPLCVTALLGRAFTLVLALLLSSCAYAQSNLSSITGTVTDTSGGAIPNSQVVIKNLSTVAVRNANTDSNGVYVAPALPIGSYSVTVTSPGFRATTSIIELTLGGVTANFTLMVGDVSQSVTVDEASGSVALQTESHEVTQTISPTQLVNLPNGNGVSVLSISVLGPASQPGTDDAESGDEGGFGQAHNAVNIAGLGLAHTQFLQDGVENVNLMTQTANVVSTVEASAGVTTTLNGSPARFGQPSVVNVITKGGTNAFHGVLYDFLQNDALNSAGYFATTKPTLRYNLFGGNLSGPIIRNKLFGFFDYSGLRSRSTSVTQSRVPTVAERAGNFAGDNISSKIYDPATYNPATGTTSPFPNSAIDPSRFNNFAKLWLAIYPLPNIPLNTATNINYNVNVPASSTTDTEISRVDWNMSTKSQATGTFSHYTSNVGTQSIIPGLFGTVFVTYGTNAMVQHTYVLAANIVNIAKVGYNRGNVLWSEYGVGAKNYAEVYGLKNLDPLPQQWAPPAVSLTNYASFSSPYVPQRGLQNRFQYADEVDWKAGKHTFAFGGQFVRTQFDGSWVVLNNGSYTFDGSATAQYAKGKAVSSTGNALADLLVGYPKSSSGSVGVSVGQFRESQVAGYIQDDWKVLPMLTLNLGLRYDFDDPPIDKNNRSAVYNLASNTAEPGTWNTNYGDWGPRFGFAWTANRKMVLRGGYGIYYSPILYNNLQYLLEYSPNFAIQSPSLNIANPVTTENQFGPGSTGTTGRAIQKNLKDQSAQEWNLNIEQSINDSTLFTIAYIGDVVRHGSSRGNANQPYALSPGNTSGILDVKPQPLTGSVATQFNVFNAGYNALAVSVQRRYVNGLLFLASYTWSKAIDIADADNTNVQDIYNVNLQRAPATFDRTNNFIFSGVYTLPFGHGQRFANNSNRVSDAIIGGWQLSVVQQVASGQPMSITANNNADTGGGTVYAVKVCDPNNGFTKTRFVFFNKACFVQPAAGQYGDARNAVRLPGLYPTNVSLFKSFRIVGEHKLQFRVDAFSLFNHPVFGQTSKPVSSPILGQLTTQASGQRSLQGSLKYEF